MNENTLDLLDNWVIFIIVLELVIVCQNSGCLVGNGGVGRGL